MKTDVIQPENVVSDESLDILEQTVRNEYKYGFVTDIEAEQLTSTISETVHSPKVSRTVIRVRNQ